MAAAAEVASRDQTLTELTEEIQQLITGLEKSNRREQDIGDIEDKIKSYNTNLDALQIELKSLPPKDVKQYRRKCTEYKKKLKEIANDLEWKKQSTVKNELMKEAADGKGVDGGPDLNSSDGMMSHGRDVLAQSDQALKGILGTIATTRDVATATAARLHEQEKQLQKVFDDLKTIDSALARSNRIIRRIGRKMATDKYLWVIIFIVIFFIIFIIAWKASGRGAASANVPSI